jgi:hypothetical protein
VVNLDKLKFESLLGEKGIPTEKINEYLKNNCYFAAKQSIKHVGRLAFPPPF